MILSDKNINDAIIILITAPSKEEAEKLALFLVNNKLAACVNILKEITSVFFWEGKLCNENETLLIIKTRGTILQKLIEEVKKIHPYSCPEIIAIPIIGGYEPYLNWVGKAVGEEGNTF